ncbi:MAG: hypothetical protein CL908_02985 [Deltaproteobacteria bacterium]|jgi:hypothetical protein|nr:hypothetical protein [Deltaproteobacteria bacterium]
MGKIIVIVILLPIVYLLALVAASEFGGEVVELETHDFRGGKYTTSLWIVDMYGDAWLRAGDPESTWLKRIREDPHVFVTRAGQKAPYRAEIVDGFSSRINAQMREKYGPAETLISTIHDADEVVAIRLGGS